MAHDPGYVPTPEPALADEARAAAEMAPALPAAGHSIGHPHHPGEKPHPTFKQYWKVALILTVITVAEVWSYYIPAFVASRAFVPSLLILSGVKFAIVVLFYMHLRYDHRLFRALFTGPLIIAITTVIVLLFLFAKVSVGA